MTIIRDANGASTYCAGQECDLCGRQLVKPPWLEWMAKGRGMCALKFCYPCCIRIRRGLVRDLNDIVGDLGDDQRPLGPMTLSASANSRLAPRPQNQDPKTSANHGRKPAPS